MIPKGIETLYPGSVTTWQFRIQAMLAIVLWALGQFEESESVIRSGLSLSAQTRHNPSMAFAHFYAAILCAIRRKSGRRQRHAPALLAIAREHGTRLWLAHARCSPRLGKLVGRHSGRRGRHAGGLAPSA